MQLYQTHSKKLLFWRILFILTLSLYLTRILAADQPSPDSSIKNYKMAIKRAFSLILEYYITDISPKTLYRLTLDELLLASAYPRVDSNDYPQELINVYEDSLSSNPSLEVLREGYIKIMKSMFLALGDEYSSFLTSNNAQALRDITSGQYSGIGLYIGRNSLDLLASKYVQIDAVVPESPADSAGLKANDIIVAINGIDIYEWDINDIQDLVRGRAGSIVELDLLRNPSEDIAASDLQSYILNAAKKLHVVLTRKDLKIRTVNTAFMAEFNLGYVQISQFGPHTFRELRLDLLRKFTNEKPLAGLILDLRNNSGGLLDAAIETADSFLKKGLIVKTESKLRFNNKTYKAKKKILVAEDIPLVILVNRNTASAAEVLAAALKDNKRAVIIGTKTLGKASIQYPVHFPDGIAKITIARYLTPNGLNISAMGISPNIEVQDSVLTPQEELAIRKLKKEPFISDLLKGAQRLREAQLESIYEQKIAANAEFNELSLDIFKSLIYEEIEHFLLKKQVYILETDLILQNAVDYLNKLNKAKESGFSER